MVKKILIISAAFLGAVIIGYLVWANSGRNVVTTTSEAFITDTVECGTKSELGNLLAIQPQMVTLDYANQASFQRKLNLYLSDAKAKGWLSQKTIVVFPEYLGSWLVIANEKQAVYQAKTMKDAMKTLILSNLFGFIKEMVSTKAKDKVKHSLFKMKGAQMAEIYQQTFSQLSKQYQVTIVAGSILLPNPELVRGKLMMREGSLYNISLVYRPDGTPYEEMVKKVYPTEDEQEFVAKAKVEELPVFETPLGKLGVLICADAWYPAPYEALAKKNTELIAVVSFGSDYQEKWQGYSGYPAPADVNLSDIGKITKREAWLKYTLPGRIKQTKAKYGVNSFLHLELWDMKPNNGYSFTVENGVLHEAKPNFQATMMSQWLN